jgi:hypothetical protein
MTSRAPRGPVYQLSDVGFATAACSPPPLTRRRHLPAAAALQGTMTWGEQNSEEEAWEQLDYALSQGVNFIDTGWPGTDAASAAAAAAAAPAPGAPAAGAASAAAAARGPLSARGGVSMTRACPWCGDSDGTA